MTGPISSRVTIPLVSWEVANSIIIPSGIATAILGWFYQRGLTPLGLTSVPPTIYFILSGFAGTMFFMTLFKRFANAKNDLFNHIGRLTLSIYVIHLLICYAATIWMQGFVDVSGSVVGISILFLLVSLFAIVVSMLMESTLISRLMIGLK